MKKGLFLVLGFSVLLTTAHAAQADGCNRYYQSAVKFIVDTPTVHPFTVSESGRQVTFSAGNLQYCPARDEWRFALRQFDRVGNGKSLYAPEGLQASGMNGNVTTVFYDSIDYSTEDNTTASGYKEIKGVPCNNLLVSKSYDGWIDLFPWATSGHGRKVKDSLAMFFHPYELNATDLGNTYNTYGYGPSFDAGHGPGALSNNIDTASGTNRFFDWGYLNVIRQFNNCTHGENGAIHAKDSTMYRPGVWRTLTSEEWKYLLTTRTVGGNDSAFTYVRLQYTDNEADTVSGVLIYPDDFSFSEASVPIMPFGANYAVTKIDAATFAALQEVGVAFLPGCHFRDFTNGVLSINENNHGYRSYYWSATSQNASNAYFVRFDFVKSTTTPSLVYDARYKAFPVRLVQDL